MYHVLTLIYLPVIFTSMEEGVGVDSEDRRGHNNDARDEDKIATLATRTDRNDDGSATLATTTMEDRRTDRNDDGSATLATTTMEDRRGHDRNDDGLA